VVSSAMFGAWIVVLRLMVQEAIVTDLMGMSSIFQRSCENAKKEY
jgi:hypothetical protein